MSTLRIQDLRVSIAGKQILNGIDLEVSSGEVHAIMGPNGSGKSTLSHALMGHPDYEVNGGSVTLDGEELLGLPTHVRAAVVRKFDSRRCCHPDDVIKPDRVIKDMRRA